MGELVLILLFILALASVLVARGLFALLVPFLAEPTPFFRLSSSKSLLYRGVPAPLRLLEPARLLVVVVAFAFLAAPLRPPLLPMPIHFARWVA